MQFDNQKTRNVADVVAKILAGESAKQEPQMLGEELVGNQHKIDANKNKKIDAHDFKLLRAQKDKEKANSQKFGKDVKEDVDLGEDFTPLSKPSHEKVATSSNTYEYKTSQAHAGKRVGVVSGPSPEYGATKPTKDNVRKGTIVKSEMDSGQIRHHIKFDDGKHGSIAHHNVYHMKEETELTESHFKVGDKVKCKTSGMKGEVVKLDKEEGGEDEKYYTIKREDGKMKKMAPNELTKINEEAELDEAMFPGTKEYEKKYGQSPQQKLKKKGDTVPTAQGEMKKTEKGVMHTRRFSEMVSAYQEQGLKYIASLVQEEPDNEEFTKEVEEVKKKATQKKTPEDEGRVAKAAVQAVKNEETEIQVINADIANGVQFDNIEERSLTEPEMKKKEEIVKSMKKGMEGFKQRYGDRAKQVAYATATKIAKEKA